MKQPRLPPTGRARVGRQDHEPWFGACPWQSWRSAFPQRLNQIHGIHSSALRRQLSLPEAFKQLRHRRLAEEKEVLYLAFSWRCSEPATTTYAEAAWTRGLPDWIGSDTRSHAFFGGATSIIVPDQWKAGVNKPCYFEPELNRTYQDWATHNGVAIVPARPRSPRDKAKVEQGVLLVQRWILAALRKRQFFLAAVSEAIDELARKLNQKPFRKLQRRLTP